MSRSKRPSILRHLRRSWFGAERSLDIRPTDLPSHHILCAGPYTVPFARLAAEAALASCPEDIRDDLNLYVHVDAIPASSRESLCRWLAEVPNLKVTYGLFGIRPGDRIPGKWHQTMINDVAKAFRAEQHIAFIDADLFIDGRGWWDCCPSLLADDVYSLTVGLRDTRRACNCVAIKTNLFTVNTAVHLALNAQRFNKDGRALQYLKREFPNLNIDVGRGLDTMVVGSLQAQLHGNRVIDVEDRISVCHVGGFSHIKAGKFFGKGVQTANEMIDAWICRLRLVTRVMNVFRERGWEAFIDPEHAAIITEAYAAVKTNQDIERRLREFPPSAHEVAFENVLAKLGY